MTATNASRKRRTEWTATGADATAEGGAPFAPKTSTLKLAPKNEPARAAIESLPNELQDPIANQVDAMHGFFNDVKRKRAKLSKLQSDATNDTDLTAPSCLRTMKCPLSGSKAVQGLEQFAQMTTEMEGHLETFRINATKVMWKATQLEIEVKTDRLIGAIHECAYDLDNVLTIMRLDAREWTIGLSKKEISGNAVELLFEKKN